MRSPRFTFAVFAFAFAFAGSAFCAAVKVDETVVGPINAGGLYFISQNDARVAYLGAKGTRTVVSVDGVEGPVLDELLGANPIALPPGQVLVHIANGGGKSSGLPSAVLFSDAGAHFAYIGRQGNEYVVIHNGKEVGRGARSALALQHMPLTLSPGGKHVFWGEMKTEAGRGVYRLIMNGKPEPWAGHQDLKPVFSPDDSRYAYLASKAEDYRSTALIVDGKLASYTGHLPQFTSDNKLLVPTTDTKGVLVDGKGIAVAGIQLEKLTPAPAGGRYAVIMRKKLVNSQGVGTLYLDGKEVPGTEGAMDITFSPDGKRYALRCANAEARSFFMVIDGKKGTEYQSVGEKAYWTPDSTKVAYTITSSGRNFVVVNTEEFAVQNVSALMRGPISVAKQGDRYGFSSVDNGNRNFLTIIDGKQVLPAGVYPDGSSLDFSDNGARYAFAVGQIGRQGMTGIVDNGKLNESLAVGQFNKFGASELANPYFILSPDGKHLARIARTAQNTHAGLYINDKLVYPTTLQVTYPAFTPDSKHLFWMAAERQAGRPGTEYVAYVDGHPAVRFTSEQMLNTKGSWRMNADGSVTCVGVSGDAMKRFRITPASDMDVESFIARAEEAQAKAIADAKAATDAKAKAKAEADATAKADADAKAKARADAAAAQAKARADAAAARKAKTGR